MAKSPKNRKIVMELTSYEAALILKLREFTHGKIMIQKLGGNPIRILAIEKSILLSPEEALKKLEVKP